MSKIAVSFPGGVAVDAAYKGHLVHTDQPVHAGGRDAALAPLDLFYVSLATCMGFYALRFCQERSIATDGLGLSLEPFRDEQTKRVFFIRVTLELPLDFPEKYRAAITRAVDLCAVKKQIVEPPEFEIVLAGAEALV